MIPSTLNLPRNVKVEVVRSCRQRRRQMWYGELTFLLNHTAAVHRYFILDCDPAIRRTPHRRRNCD